MIRPDQSVVDTEEMQDWVLAHKESSGWSWARLGEVIGVPGGTLQPFANKKYAGDTGRIAREIWKYRQTEQIGADRKVGIPTDPGFFSTPTAQRLESLMSVAQHFGRITVGATGPGTGKTKTMLNYRACNANVWTATMRESTSTLSQMQWEVAKAVGEPLKASYSAGASRTIMDKVRGRRGLIIIDEANCLETKAIEEIRAWNDDSRVGICLLGNEELLLRIEAGRRRDAFARLNSRIAQRFIQSLPEEADVVAFCDAWQIDEPAMRKLLTDVALNPASGGLRECEMLIESASMLAMLDERALTLSDLREARANRATRRLRV